MAWLARGGFATSVSGGRDMDSLTGICSQMVAAFPVIGMVEVKGTAEALRPLVSHLAEQPCVYYSWSVAEHWSRTVTETYRDSDGKTKTRTRHESGWTTVADGGEQSPFYLKDDAGIVQVQPEGAKIEPRDDLQRVLRPGRPTVLCERPGRRGGSFGSPQAVHRDSHSDPYAAVRDGPGGSARTSSPRRLPGIPDCPMFLISSRDEQEISLGFATDTGPGGLQDSCWRLAG